jgi:hypothetical protein
MSHDYLVHPVAVAATTQVKLCPCDEEEPHIWFHLIEAQFAAAGIKSQKLKYANSLANLLKQVLRDILDTLDVYNESDEPFDCLKDPLLGQFRKSKLWKKTQQEVRQHWFIYSYISAYIQALYMYCPGLLEYIH